METALTIAGSDSGGGAGIQADLKTFEAYGVYGTTVITALTAQNTVGVQAVFPAPVEIIKAQLRSVLSDFDIRAVKTGMLFSIEIIEAVAEELKQRNMPLVVDPVMVSTSGHALLKQDALESMKKKLFPLARVITPNLNEAELLTGHAIHTRKELEAAALELSAAFPGRYILLKGGHLAAMNKGKEQTITDILVYDGKVEYFEGPYIDTANTHGTGCTLSAAIVAGLVKGMDVPQSVASAKRYITDAIRFSWENIGKGNGSLRHNFQKLKPAK